MRPGRKFARFPARRQSARCAPMCPERTRAITSQPTSLSICCLSSTRKPGGACGTTRKSGTLKFAAGHSPNWTSIFPCMPELAAEINRFLDELRRENASAHTVRNYASDLAQFLEYFTIQDKAEHRPSVEEIDALAIREWLGHLYEQQLTAVSMRRKLAAARSFFKFLLRHGVVAINVARLVRTPQAPKTVPAGMTAKQTNTLVEGVAADKVERAYPARDLAIFE